MRVDVHCHVFTFSSFLTAAAERNLVSRLGREYHLSQEACNDLVKIAKKIVLPKIQRGNIPLIARLLGLTYSHPAFKFLSRGCMQSISDVTDEHMSDLQALDPSEEWLAAALMMDVVDEDSTAAERRLFAGQYADTVLQAIRYPGRVLPFVAVNPLRSDEALECMINALDTGECVGVKLYPSLGWDINDTMLADVMACCQTRGAPIIMHCNDGGFRGTGPYDAMCCSPVSWRDVIKATALAGDPAYGFRFDFAHFGDQTPGAPGADTNWRDRISSLIGEYPGHVYADVSYQSGPLGNAIEQAQYIRWLMGELGSSRGCNICFGTDSYMLLQSADVATYWRFFENMLGAGLQRMAEVNPARFLGFMAGPRQEDCYTLDNGDWRPQPGSSLERHATFLAGKAEDPSFGDGAAPASWLTRLWAERPLPRP